MQTLCLFTSSGSITCLNGTKIHCAFQTGSTNYSLFQTDEELRSRWQVYADVEWPNVAQVRPFLLMWYVVLSARAALSLPNSTTDSLSYPLLEGGFLGIWLLRYPFGCSVCCRLCRWRVYSLVGRSPSLHKLKETDLCLASRSVELPSLHARLKFVLKDNFIRYKRVSGLFVQQMWW